MAPRSYAGAAGVWSALALGASVFLLVSCHLAVVANECGRQGTRFPHGRRADGFPSTLRLRGGVGAGRQGAQSGRGRRSSGNPSDSGAKLDRMNEKALRELRRQGAEIRRERREQAAVRSNDQEARKRELELQQRILEGATDLSGLTREGRQEAKRQRAEARQRERTEMLAQAIEAEERRRADAKLPAMTPEELDALVVAAAPASTPRRAAPAPPAEPPEGGAHIAEGWRRIVREERAERRTRSRFEWEEEDAASAPKAVGSGDRDRAARARAARAPAAMDEEFLAAAVERGRFRWPPPPDAGPARPEVPPPPRTKWTRRVPHPVLIGHTASLAPY